MIKQNTTNYFVEKNARKVKKKFRKRMKIVIN